MIKLTETECLLLINSPDIKKFVSLIVEPEIERYQNKADKDNITPHEQIKALSAIAALESIRRAPVREFTKLNSARERMNNLSKLNN